MDQNGQNWVLTPDFKTAFEQLKNEIAEEIRKTYERKQAEDWASQWIPIEMLEEETGLTARWWRSQSEKGNVSLSNPSPRKFLISRQEYTRFMLERESGFRSGNERKK